MANDAASGWRSIGPEHDSGPILEHLERVLASAPFARAPRMQRFLRFLVEESLAGRAARLKEYTIAIGVFGKPADFEPGTSAVVRVEAGRLRRLLSQYNAEHDSGDLIVLEVPKGSYVPVFAAASPRPSDSDAPAPASPGAGDLPPATVEPTPRRGRGWSAEERRLVTVLSCGFGDGRALSDLSTQGEFLSLFDRLYEICVSIARTHCGEVDAGASDRLMAYFGWPSALEDAAGHAMTAALEIIRTLQADPQAGDLGVRIGIATSEVVAREAAPGGSKLRPSVVGEAPSIATEILSRAPLNGVLVAEVSRRLTGAAFDFLPAGALRAEDAKPCLLWRLLRPKPAVTRFRAVHAGPQAEIVGRREELALVLSRWRLSAEGEGQAVVLVGEAGIGKSSLAEAALEAIKADSDQVRAQCSPHHANSTLFPIAQTIRDQLGAAEGAEDIDGVRVEAFLSDLGLDDPVDRAILLSLLVQSEEPDAISRLSASQKKDLTLRLLNRIFLARAQRGAVALLVEDAHWADPTTLEFLQDLIGACANRRLLIVLTSRSPLDALLGASTHVTSVRLARLPKVECNDLIDRMLNAASLSDASRAVILEKADGIPLFIEELTKLFLSSESQLLERPVPESLNDLLASQLDRLGSTRSIAQLAAVIGRQFPREMLAAVSGHSDAEIDTALDQLLSAGVLVKEGDAALGLFAFRHALLRDAAYASLLDHSRRALHYQVGGALIDGFPAVASEHPEIIARHMTDAGRADDSIPFWIDAGRRAAERYALTEAIADFRLALDALKTLRKTRENHERELEVLIDLGLAIRNARGYFDEELSPIYERARNLARELGKQDQHANAVYGLWTHAAGRGQWKRATGLAEQFAELASEADATDQLRVEASRLLGASAAFRGEFTVARGHLEQVLAVYDVQRHGPRFGFDPGAVAAAYLAWTTWHLGHPETARAYAAKALEIADAKGHPSTLAMVLSWLMFHAACEDDAEAILAYNQRLQLVCAERDCRYWQPFGDACAEWAAFQQDGEPRRLDRLVASTTAFREHYLTSCLLLLAARICAELNLPERGLELVEAAESFIAEHDERVWGAEAGRIGAELMLANPEADARQAEARLLSALATARHQGAVSLEARAAQALRSLNGRDDRARRTAGHTRA